MNKHVTILVLRGINARQIKIRRRLSSLRGTGVYLT